MWKWQLSYIFNTVTLIHCLKKLNVTMKSTTTVYSHNPTMHCVFTVCRWRFGFRTDGTNGSGNWQLKWKQRTCPRELPIVWSGCLSSTTRTTSPRHTDVRSPYIPAAPLHSARLYLRLSLPLSHQPYRPLYPHSVIRIHIHIFPPYDHCTGLFDPHFVAFIVIPEIIVLRKL